MVLRDMFGTRLSPHMLETPHLLSHAWDLNHTNRAWLTPGQGMGPNRRAAVLQ